MPPDLNASDTVPGAPQEETVHLAPAAALAFNRANAAFRAGHWTDALVQCDTALVAEPTLVNAAVLRARCLTNMGRLDAAREAYTAALRLAPEDFSAWLELGNVCRRLGSADRAMACYDRAVACRRDDARGHLALARALEETGDPMAAERAAVHYHRALSIAQGAPGGGQAAVARTLHGIGRVRLDAGDVPRALESLRQAVMAARLAGVEIPADDLAGIRIDMAEALLRLGLTDDANCTLEEASQATGEETLLRLADLSYRFNLWKESVAVLRRNLALHPDSTTGRLHLADMLSRSWQLEAALDTLDAAERDGSLDRAATLGTRAVIAGRMGDADEAMRLYRQMIDDGDAGMRSSLAMTSLYSDSLTPEQVSKLHRGLFAPLGAGVRARDSFGNNRSPDRPLRIGMVTGDLHHQHPVNIFLQPMLAQWDHDRFPLTLYYTGKTFDEQTRLAKSRATTWRVIAHALLSREVEADRIDILIDLAGHTSRQNMAAFAQRLAPVQATFLGYPGSTGVPNMDWIFGDPVVTPIDHDHLCSENVYRLPGPVFCYAPEEDYSFPEFSEEIETRPLTFGSFNNVPKLTPHTVALWARVLKAVPDARLLLKAPSFRDGGAVVRFGDLFAGHGVAPDRLDFRGPTALHEMMAEYAEVDIGLDPVPYNGGTTTLQAMWMGVPVITRIGGTFVSRMGASFMTAAGLPDWVAPDDDGYVDIAIRMAANRTELLRMKRTLRQRLTERPGWSMPTYLRSFENGLSTMWSRSL